MNTYPEKPLGAFLELDVVTEPVDPDKIYTTAGIYSYGRGLFKRSPITGLETKYPRYTKLREGQFVYSKLFGWEGALATVDKEFDGLYVSHEFPTFSIDDATADQRYVSHLARWEGLHVKLRDKGTGMGSRRQRVNIDRLLATTAPLPDLEEQRRIANHLDSARNKLEKLERLYKYRSRLKLAVNDSLVEQVVTKCDTQVRIDTIATASRMPIDIDPNKSYQALGMRSFGKGTIRYPVVLGDQLSKLRYYRFPSGALALSNIKAWEGAIGLTEIEDADCVASNRFLFYSARDERVNLHYLKHYLLSRRGLAQISSCSPGSADRNRTLSIKRFESLIVPLPSKREQDKLTEILNGLQQNIDVSGIQKTKSALEASLLNAAFGGHL
jgi:type I restriction enzyme, S subunit